MRQLGIQARIRRKHSNRVYPNLIKDFLTTGINQVWCSDITYIHILFGFVYLSVIIDIYSRKIVGYAIAKTLSPELTIAALHMAIANRNTKSLIKTLKQEEVYLWQYETYLDVVTRIPYFISDVYNKKRLHSALGYRPPEEFEQQLAEDASHGNEMAKTLFV